MSRFLTCFVVCWEGLGARARACWRVSFFGVPARELFFSFDSSPPSDDADAGIERALSPSETHKNSLSRLVVVSPPYALSLFVLSPRSDPHITAPRYYGVAREERRVHAGRAGWSRVFSGWSARTPALVVFPGAPRGAPTLPRARRRRCFSSRNDQQARARARAAEGFEQRGERDKATTTLPPLSSSSPPSVLSLSLSLNPPNTQPPEKPEKK